MIVGLTAGDDDSLIVSGATEDSLTGDSSDSNDIMFTVEMSKCAM